MKIDVSAPQGAVGVLFMHRSSSMSDALKQQELQTKPKSLTFYGWVIFGRQILISISLQHKVISKN